MDNNNMMPELTLTPFADKPAEKPAEPEVPAAQDAEKDLGVTLTPEEKKMVADFAAKIDITDPNIVLQYGAGSQQKIAKTVFALTEGYFAYTTGSVMNIDGGFTLSRL